MTEGTEWIPRLDYNKPPPGYRLLSAGDRMWWGSDAAWLDTAGGRAAAISAAWSHYKAHNDPPGCVLEQGLARLRGRAEFDALRAETRAAAWVWYDRRLAAHARVADDPRHRIDFCGSCGAENEPQDDDECPACGSTSCLISTWGEQQAERYRTSERYTANDPSIDDASPTWPRCLTWSDEQVAAVERWLADSTAEIPEVLRG